MLSGIPCPNDLYFAYHINLISMFRSPGADFLVGDGPSKTWLVGNALVTVTMSGSGGGAQGVCPRCVAIKRSLMPDPDVLLSGNESYLPYVQRDSDVDGIQLCSCWCRGWAEIKIRRPTGNIAWLMRVQNKLDILATPHDMDYEWSLMGINRLDGSGEWEGEGGEEGEREEEEESWGPPATQQGATAGTGRARAKC